MKKNVRTHKTQKKNKEKYANRYNQKEQKVFLFFFFWEFTYSHSFFFFVSLHLLVRGELRKVVVFALSSPCRRYGVDEAFLGNQVVYD
jgi:hypothetical protein